MAITTNNLQTTRSTTNANSYTLASYAVASGSNRVLVVRVMAMRGAETNFTLSATFNSVSMTEAVTHTANTTSRWYRSSIFYLIAPDETTADVVVSVSATIISCAIAVETLHGAAQSSLIGQTDTDSTNSTAATVTLSLLGCSTNSRIIAAVVSNSGGPPTWSWGTASEDYDLAHATAELTEMAGSGGSYETSGGDVTVTATRSANAFQAAVAAEFKQAATGGLVVPVFMHHYRQMASI